MFLEILQPQGDPFAEPQVLVMNYFLQNNVFKDLAEKLEKRLNKFAAKQNVTNGSLKGEEKIGEEYQKERHNIKRYLHRLLLLWSQIMKFCSDNVITCYPASSLAILVNQCVNQVDNECEDKFLQMEFIKFIRKLLIVADDSIDKLFLQMDYFIKIIKRICHKENMLSAQVYAVFEEMKKLHCFKLHKTFIETNRLVLEGLKAKNKFIEALLNHNKRVRSLMKNSSHTEEERGSERHSERKSVTEQGELNGPISPLSMENAHGGLPDIDLISSKQMEQFFRKKKENFHEDDEGNDSHEIFPGLVVSKHHSPKKSSDIHMVQEALENSDPNEQSAESEGSSKLMFYLDLKKREDESSDDDEDMPANSGYPQKRMSM